MLCSRSNLRTLASASALVVALWACGSGGGDTALIASHCAHDDQCGAGARCAEGVCIPETPVYSDAGRAILECSAPPVFTVLHRTRRVDTFWKRLKPNHHQIIIGVAQRDQLDDVQGVLLHRDVCDLTKKLMICKVLILAFSKS